MQVVRGKEREKGRDSSLCPRFISFTPTLEEAIRIVNSMSEGFGFWSQKVDLTGFPYSSNNLHREVRVRILFLQSNTTFPQPMGS